MAYSGGRSNGGSGGGRGLILEESVVLLGMVATVSLGGTNGG